MLESSSLWDLTLAITWEFYSAASDGTDTIRQLNGTPNGKERTIFSILGKDENPPLSMQ